MSVYGERRGASVEALVTEWHDALRFYDPELVTEAWTDYRNSSEFWPTPAAILTRVRSNLPAPGRPAFRSETREDFCREGRTEAEEIAHRAAQILRIKREAAMRYAPTFQGDDEAKPPEPQPASQAQTVSPQLQAIAKKGGYWHGASEPSPPPKDTAQ